MAAAKNGADLSTYRRKRKPGATPEPFGASRPPASRFVVQLHDARRRHYDFRLEHGGVLLSWAVPKGPSLDPADKRLAVRTEDHPLDYADFEGVIPRGQYGAGPVIVWDRGRFEPQNDFDAGLAAGKLLFDLHGHKLHGRWTLVKTSRNEQDWLLIKERDAYVRRGDRAALPDDSVLSGYSVEGLAEGEDRDAALAEACREAGARPAPLTLESFAPMLATPSAPFSRKGWWFEIDYAGLRVLAGRIGGAVRVTGPGRQDLAAVFPEIAEAVAALPYTEFLLDGHVVVMGPDGLPDRALLDARSKLEHTEDVEQAAATTAASLQAFDLPFAAGFDLRPRPLETRKRLLQRLLPSAGAIRYVDHFERDGARLHDEALNLGLDGVIGRRAESPYTAGVSSDWVRFSRTGEARDAAPDESAAEDAGTPRPGRTTGGRPPRVEITNRSKVFWPAEGYTKGDLADYYAAVAPKLLPYLADRPLVLTRFPDGIEGKSFFQKDAPGSAPDWLRLESLWSETSKRAIRYFVIDDAAGLRHVANLASIPLHVWSSRVSRLDRPDWCILDLDPKGAPLEHVVQVAREIHRLCRDVGLPSYPKTSGATGLHVLIPLGARYTHEQSRAMAELLARWIARRLPDIATVRRQVKARDGKVYVDYLQNGHGKLLVAPYSARPVPGATVSMPLRWDQVTPQLDLGHYTIKTVPQLLEDQPDPLAPVLDEAADLQAALERLDRLAARS